MILNRFLTLSALAGLALATNDKKCILACKAVEATISDASKIYYPGECE